MNNIWIFWMGGNFSKNRKESIQSIILNSGCTVTLVTYKNLKLFEVPSDPIHPAFEYLSAVHRSDMLRSYFMYHYGGGYTDIKKCHFSWASFFDYLNDSSFDFLGYPENSIDDVPLECAEEVRNYWPNLVGNGMFIFKPQTQFAKQWLDSTKLTLDRLYPLIKENPGWYHPRAFNGGVQSISEGQLVNSKNIENITKYPVRWAEIMAEIFHPLQFENRTCYRAAMPRINCDNYL